MKNKDGSSMISVLVAFIILLIGIAGFSRAVTTANDMVRRAEMLNTATGKVLGEYFYPDYASENYYEGYVLNVYEGEAPGSGTPAFQIPGRLVNKNYTVTITDDTDGSGTELTYDMYFYK